MRYFSDREVTALLFLFFASIAVAFTLMNC